MAARSLLCILSVVLAALGMVRAGPPPGNTEAPKRLPPEVATAWKEAGAEVGWVRADRYRHVTGFLPFEGYFQFFPDREGKPGDLPAFRFAKWRPGGLTKLPVPATAFGLDLGGAKETDAGLKALSRLGSLQTLDLRDTKVTDAGLEQLHEALPGCRIDR